MEILFNLARLTTAFLAICVYVIAAWMFFKSFRCNEGVPKIKRWLFLVLFSFWALALFWSMIALSKDFTIEETNNLMPAGIALLLSVVAIVFYRRAGSAKNIAKMYFYTFLTFVMSFSIMLVEKIELQSYFNKAEICRVVSIFEQRGGYIGIPNSSDKELADKFYVTLRHEQTYNVYLDSVSAEKISVSVCPKSTEDPMAAYKQTKLVISHETIHLLEKSENTDEEKLRYISRLRPGNMVYFYKGEILYPR